MRIEQPGVYEMSDADYFSDPCPSASLNNSLMKVLLRSSPHHAWLEHPRLNPNYKPREKEERFDLGTAAHAMALEGKDVAVPMDFADWRTKESQAQRDLIRAQGQVPMLREQYERTLRMAEAINDFVQHHGWLRDVWQGPSEHVICWQRDIWCRAKIDKMAPDMSWLIDLKTTNTASPREFVSSMLTYGYDTQAEFYTEGAQSTGARGPRFAFLVCEDHGTHECYLVEPSAGMAELASRKISKAVGLWKQCLRTDNWPAYSTDIYVAEPPAWAMRELEAME